jgi:myo-inositol-1(or 4)-monophosphatase
MSEFLDTAIYAARQAGEYIKGVIEHEIKYEKKGAIDLVTDADRQVEKMIRDIVAERYPEHGFKAEEGTEHGGELSYLWLVDPIDGTTNFIHHFPFYCVSVALLKEDQLFVGCIYHPDRDECFTAERGRGAYLNGRKISVSKEQNLNDAFLATGFPYDIRTSDENNLREFNEFAIQALAIRRAGSAALDLAYVACGRFDGYWEMKVNP